LAELTERYGAILLSMAIECGGLGEAEAQAAECLAVARDPEVRRIMAHPGIPKAGKLAAFGDQGGSGDVGAVMGFIRMMVGRNGGHLIEPSLEAFLDGAERRRGVTWATVVTADAMGGERLGAIRGTLSGKLGKEVRIVHRVDPSLIGGMYVLVDGMLMDHSIRRRLSDMRMRLIGGPAGGGA